jgi:hypothetical protein
MNGRIWVTKNGHEGETVLEYHVFYKHDEIPEHLRAAVAMMDAMKGEYTWTMGFHNSRKYKLSPIGVFIESGDAFTPNGYIISKEFLNGTHIVG